MHILKSLNYIWLHVLSPNNCLLLYVISLSYYHFLFYSLCLLFQGLDPRYTAKLFLDAKCVGEKTIENEVCFSLKLDTPMHILKSHSSPHTEVVRHTIWGYFSQRTGLLVKFEDNKLVKMKPPKGTNDTVFWETKLVSVSLTTRQLMLNFLAVPIILFM